ncbi:unnamed protein product [Dicrocoelium dendriticum]|nr:unnamed protein product [Dicrocoelium dendriticum]
MSIWLALLLLAIFWLLCLIFSLAHRHATLLSGPVLLVTAHPDDESMFFAPTLLHLHAAGVQTHLLCFSTGNHEGLGSIRQQELSDAAKRLHLHHICVIDRPTEFPDDPHQPWPLSSIVDEVQSTCSLWGIQTVITFDEYGVSGHSNHRALSSALRCAQQNYDHTSPLPSIYYLQSLPITQKYCPIIDAFISIIISKHQLILCTPWHLLTTPYTAMISHWSQMVWFRWFYILFSVYMYKNVLISSH